VAQVLVVDADPAVAGIIEFHLKRGGHQVIVARSPQDALASVADRHETPDLAVLDVALPGMTGFELLESLRSTTGNAELGAVFLSSRTKPRDIEMGRHLGAANLTKPLVGADLLEAVEQVMAGTGPAPLGT
jgi:DNA-binding response OmpR family regulator